MCSHPQNRLSHIFFTMATRSRIGIELQDGSILSAYHHYDGYPDFLGVALADFINNVGDKHNGVHCFAAQLLTHLKLGIHYGKCSNDSHNVYLETPGDEHGDLDYTYYLWWGKNEVWISIFDLGYIQLKNNE